jgi:hypothetical protein
MLASQDALALRKWIMVIVTIYDDLHAAFLHVILLASADPSSPVAACCYVAVLMLHLVMPLSLVKGIQPSTWESQQAPARLCANRLKEAQVA